MSRDAGSIPAASTFHPWCHRVPGTDKEDENPCYRRGFFRGRWPVPWSPRCQLMTANDRSCRLNQRQLPISNYRVLRIKSAISSTGSNDLISFASEASGHDLSYRFSQIAGIPNAVAPTMSDDQESPIITAWSGVLPRRDNANSKALGSGLGAPTSSETTNSSTNDSILMAAIFLTCSARK